MHRSALLLFCLAHEGLGWRDQNFREQIQQNLDSEATSMRLDRQAHAKDLLNPLGGLASMLLALNPSIAFDTSSLGRQFPFGTRSRSHRVVSGSQRRLDAHAPLMSMGDVFSSPSEESSLDSSTQLSRRAVLGLAATLPLLSGLPASALFESKEQQLFAGVANLMYKLKGVIAEQEEVRRKRAYLLVDPNDDAAVVRFITMYLDPVVKDLKELQPAIKADRAVEITDEWQKVVQQLKQACRRNDAVKEVEELKNIRTLLDEFLALGGSLKYDVTPRNDINNFEQIAPYLYPKAIFRFQR